MIADPAAYATDGRASLAVVGGRPAVAYGGTYTAETTELRYVRALDAAGPLWPTEPEIVDPAATGHSIGRFSLMESAGQPLFGFWSIETGANIAIFR